MEDDCSGITTITMRTISPIALPTTVWRFLSAVNVRTVQSEWVEVLPLRGKSVFMLFISKYSFSFLCMCVSVGQERVCQQLAFLCGCASANRLLHSEQARIACWWSAGPIIRRLRVRILARVVGEFSSSEFVCWLLFGVHSTHVLRQWHVKDTGHSAKSAGGRLHLSMHTPLIEQKQSGLTMPLSRYSVGTYEETSSHTTHQETLSHSHLSSLSHCRLILA